MRIVAGEWRGRVIKAPKGQHVRPTGDRVREAWMNIIATQIPGARVVDLFAGSGALGIEALSRGAAHATFVDEAITRSQHTEAFSQEGVKLPAMDVLDHMRIIDQVERIVGKWKPPVDVDRHRVSNLRIEKTS